MAEGIIKTVFVVDDSATNLSMAEVALENNYRVLTFISAEKMFQVLTKVIPNLILLDIEMPEMNGFDAMKQLKANDLYSKIPVFFLTAAHDPVNEARGIELGACGYITKPFYAAELLDKINAYV